MATRCRALAVALCALILAFGCSSGSSAPPTAYPTATSMPTVQVSAPEMVLVEAGGFKMGCASGQADEQPVHAVRITRPFYVARYAVTFEEYDRFCEDVRRTKPDDVGRGRGMRPVINVEWYGAVDYCNWLSEKQGLTQCCGGQGRLTECDFSADGYRLPTEAEWEYAARGGNRSRGFTYAGSDDVDEVAWYAANSGGQMHEVGLKKPNELGLYDMSGNLYEWCWDAYGEDYYASSPSEDPKGPPPQSGTTPWGPNRVRRGGSWREEAGSVRVACRSFDYAGYVGDNGFRVVRTE